VNSGQLRKLSLAACGIDCTGCDIRLASLDPERAQALTKWFKEHGHPDARPEWFRCDGCFGSRELHWSADCAILRCCVDERDLASCADCGDFPCNHLQSFEKDGMGHHRAAVARLRKLVDARQGGLE
jgi:hypothetical protein